MTKEIVKKLIGEDKNPQQLLESLTNEGDIHYVNFFLSLTGKSLTEKLAILTTADHNEKLLILTHIIDVDVEEEIVDPSTKKVLLTHSKLLKEIYELTP